MTRSQTALGRILGLDALTCAAMGLLLLAASGPVARLTDLPPSLLFYAGALLIPIAIYMAIVARYGTSSSLAVWSVILGNMGWVLVSLALFVFIAPNAIGVAFILAQAAVVGLLAWLEYLTWRMATARQSSAA